MITFVLTVILGIAAFVILGTLTVLIIGGVVAAAGWFLGIIAAILDLAVWVAAGYIIYKAICKMV